MISCKTKGNNKTVIIMGQGDVDCSRLQLLGWVGGKLMRARLCGPWKQNGTECMKIRKKITKEMNGCISLFKSLMMYLIKCRLSVFLKGQSLSLPILSMPHPCHRSYFSPAETAQSASTACRNKNLIDVGY